MIYRAKDKDGLIFLCNCGCGDGYSFQLFEDEDFYCFSSCVTSKFLAESKSRRVRQKLKMIWTIARGKDYTNHDVILNRAELKQLAEIFVEMSSREVKNTDEK